MTQTSTPKHLLSKDYRRLQDIEEHVARCVELAADCVDVLLGKQGAEKQLNTRQTCIDFLNEIKAVQNLIQEAVGTSPTSRNFEATSEVYIAVYKAETAALKLRVIQDHLNEMYQVIDSHKQSNQAPIPQSLSHDQTNGHHAAAEPVASPLPIAEKTVPDETEAMDVS